MSIDMSQFFQVFFEESAEHLAEMERLLLEMDVESPDIEEMNAIFRAAHSIKGGSGTFGFTDMTEVTHVLENLLDRLRKGEMAPRTEMIDAFLEAADVLKEQLACHINGTDAEPHAAEAICNKLRALTQDQPAPGEGAAQSSATSEVAPNSAIDEIPVFAAPTTMPAAVDEDSQALPTFDIFFRPGKAFLKRASGLEELEDELAHAGTLLKIAEPALAEEDAKKGKKNKKAKKSKAKTAKPEWHYALTTAFSIEAIQDIFAFIVEPEDVTIVARENAASAISTAASEADDGFGFFDPLPEAPNASAMEDDGFGFFEPLPDAPAADEGYGFFTEPPAPEATPSGEAGYGFFTEIQPSDPQPSSTQEVNGDGFGFFAPLPTSPAAAPQTPPATVKPAEAKAKEKPAASAASGETSIRVGVERVDQLINLVGELVITQAMLAQTASNVDPILYEQLHNGLAQLERNTRDLQESVMSIRMMPVSFVFSRFPRVVRDLASKLNKQVELVTVGDTTELDKGLIEKIADPLTHLVRNSLDHGIELPEKRIAAGKPAKGTITLSASNQGGAVVIEVTDDGGGLNREKILSKAMERGLHASETMSDNDVWMLIFEPGFSTADVVTDVSGRGVGMDVVKRNITEMGGVIQIGSAPGVGTTMTIRLPLTLAILDGMSVSLGGSLYVIPLNQIVETLQPQPEDIKTVTGQGHMVHVRGEYLPIIALHRLFNMPTEVTDPCHGVLVLIEAEGKKAALFVDALVGQQQVVIKSLETNFRKVVGVSGATIMGDGTVALILDVPTLIKLGQGNI